MLRLLSFLFLLFLSLGSIPLWADELHWKTEQLEHQDLDREYFVFKPKKKKLSLTVVALHGGGGDVKSFEKLANFRASAQRHGYLLVMPQGHLKNWNDGRPEVDNQEDDVSFLKALKEEVVRKFKADPRHFVLVGISNGGLMAFRMMCEEPKSFKGFVSVVANISESTLKKCNGKSATSFLHIVGDQDPLMPYQGGDVRGPLGFTKRGKVVSATATQDFFHKKFHCSTLGQPSTQNYFPKDGTSLARTQFSCDQSTISQFVVVKGGGHAWPGGPQYLSEKIVGRATKEFSATEEVVQFYRSLLKPTKDNGKKIESALTSKELTEKKEEQK